MDALDYSLTKGERQTLQTLKPQRGEGRRGRSLSTPGAQSRALPLTLVQ